MQDLLLVKKNVADDIPFVVKLYFPLTFNTYNEITITLKSKLLFLQHLLLISIFQIGGVVRFFKNASKKSENMSFRLPNTWCSAFLQERIQKSENMSFRLLNTWCYAFLEERIQKSITTGYGKKTVWDLERAHAKGYLSIESRKKRQKRPKNDKNNWFSKLLK